MAWTDSCDVVQQLGQCKSPRCGRRRSDDMLGRLAMSSLSVTLCWSWFPTSSGLLLSTIATHVALCIQADMNLKSIQSRLGHSSIRVTVDRYGHLLQAVEDRDSASLGALGIASQAL